MTAVPPPCDGGCDPASYWRQEAADARAEATALRRAARAVAGSRIPATGMLAYEDGPAPMSTGERLLALALVGPWIACAAGWSVVVGAGEVLRWARR